jgi:hypothetical protein
MANEISRFQFVIQNDDANYSYIKFFPVNFTGTQTDFRRLSTGKGITLQNGYFK